MNITDLEESRIITNKFLFFVIIFMIDVLVIIIGSNLFSPVSDYSILLDGQGFLVLNSPLELEFSNYVIFISIFVVLFQTLIFIFFIRVHLQNQRYLDSKKFNLKNSLYLIIPILYFLVSMFLVPAFILFMVYLIGSPPAFYLFRAFFARFFATKLLLGVFLFFIRYFYMKVLLPRHLSKLKAIDLENREYELKQEEIRIKALNEEFKLTLKTKVKPLLSQLLPNQEINVVRVIEVLSSESDSRFVKVNEAKNIRSAIDEYLIENANDYEFIVLNDSIRKIA